MSQYFTKTSTNVVNCWNISGKRVWFLRAISPDNKNWRLRFSLSFPREHFQKSSENVIVFVPVHTGSAVSVAKVHCTCALLFKIKVACAPWDNSYGRRPSNSRMANCARIFIALPKMWICCVNALTNCYIGQRLSIANSLAYSLQRFQSLSGICVNAGCFLTLCVNRECFWKKKNKWKFIPVSGVNDDV